MNPNLSSSKKTFILDTNVLLHDPESIFKFEKDNTVVIPIEVLEELDRFKSTAGELGYNARAVHRSLRDMFNHGRPLTDMAVGSPDSPEAIEARLPHGGNLQILINQYLVSNAEKSPGIQRLKATIGNMEKPDHRILASTIYVKEQHGKNVILVSKDGNMAMKALALGIQSEDYLNDKVKNPEADGLKEMKIGIGAFDRLEETGESKITQRQADKLVENEYIYVHDGVRKALVCFNSPKAIRSLLIPDFHTSIAIPKGNKVFCKNDEQLIFMDALLNPEVKIVTCKGKAGTGKTFLAMASALAQTLGVTFNGGFERVYISRPTVEIGKDPGALPGDKDAKMAPYMQNYFDNLEVLFSPKRTVPKSVLGKAASQRKKKREIAKRQNGQTTNSGQEDKFDSFLPIGKPYNFLLESGVVQIEALAYIRGRSISNTFFILDEVQNLTPSQTKAAVTRLASGSKMVLMGDTEQIDNPFLDARSNGLAHVRERLRGTPLSAHCRLDQSVRSEAAELAASRL